ncbi:hypothetical protein M408DRAFT_330145 [Serendipita vermifera MAFF 305830]|uniref:FAD dependent oxidoreductase domain-containing protein n=1 Tax=Serendipita vermifera MAFF 305830 TaxID=933852 RepID=A0A0C2WLP3_SERVB|nr:hypothetical protein M408DRAFT_330145 [Serendipita vermifera MAFF 305830]
MGFVIWKEAISYNVIYLALAIISAYLPYRLWSVRQEDRYNFAVYTAMNDLDVLERRSSRTKLAGTAVIVGGSITGLLAASVCADHFEHVVILEADEGADTEFPAAKENKIDPYGNSNYVSRRPRVAQTFAIHMYQPFALLTLRRLIPDFDEKFIKAGGRIKPRNCHPHWSGIKLGIPASCRLKGIRLPAHHNLPKEDLPNTIWCTRANLEPFLRKEILKAHPGIEFMTGTVTSLTRGDGGGIDEVIYHLKGQKDMKSMEASLVVDCTGHSKAGVKWLEHLGIGPIPQVSYDPLQRYTTVWFKLDEEKLQKLPLPEELRDKELFFYAIEDDSLGGHILWGSRGENGTIGLSFGGLGIQPEELPKTPEELKDFYRQFKAFNGEPMDDWYYDLVDFLAQDGGWEKAHYEECKIPPCVYVKYHEVVSSLPPNFVTLGDAVMRSSPIYGLGVTKGFVGAVTLAGALDKAHGRAIPGNFARNMMISLDKRTGWSWDQAKDAGYGYPTTIPCEGESLDVGASTRAATKEFFHLTTFDEEARVRFYYPRLWLYPNAIRLSPRILEMITARLAPQKA